MNTKIIISIIALLVSLSAFSQSRNKDKEAKVKELSDILRKDWNAIKQGRTADKSLENLQQFQQQIKAIANKGSMATEAEIIWVLNPEYPQVKAAYFKDLSAAYKSGKITQKEVNQVYRKFYGVYKKTRSKAVKSMEAFRRSVEGMTGLQYERRQKTPYFRQSFSAAIKNIEKDLEENGMEPMTDEQKRELHSEFSAVQGDVKEADAATEAINILNEQFADCPGCITTKAQ